ESQRQLFQITQLPNYSFTQSSRVRLEHLVGVLQGRFGQLGATQHSGDFFRAFVAGKLADAGSRTVAYLLLLDQVMMIGEGGNLRQMGNTKHLIRAREGLQFLPYRLGRAAADSRID